MAKAKAGKRGKKSTSAPDRLVKNLGTRVSKDTQRKVKGGMATVKLRDKL